VNARPGEPEHDGEVPGVGVPGEPGPAAPGEAAATWVPPASPDAGHPAWLPPGARPGEPYGPPAGQEGFGTGLPPPPVGPYGGPHQYAASYQDPYGTPPPHPGPYGAPPPYVAGPTGHRPRMPRWAKIVLVVGIGLYLISAVAQVVNLLLFRHG
jgi:hypothetical protein